MMKNVMEFIKKETVLCAAMLLALVSVFFVTPDREYFSYIDYRTLALLFCLMSVMAGFQKLGVFGRLAETMLKKVKGNRPVAAILVLLCFFTSMIITNDVALITFVPFTIAVLRLAEGERLMVPIVALQTIAANLGSMLTPIGNPQNLYLYSRAGIGLGDFLMLMLPFSAVSLLLLAIAILTIRSDGPAIGMQEEINGEIKDGKIDGCRMMVYIILFGLCICSVAHWIPWQVLLAIVAAVTAITDRKLWRQIDYSLLLTFTGFFIFVGNMGRIPSVREFIERMAEGREVLTSIAASQIISNVPAALMLSGFTDKWELLIIGTNLGGLGTLIASMASLISFKYVAKECPGKKKEYIGYFTILNIIFLVVLYFFSQKL